MPERLLEEWASRRGLLKCRPRLFVFDDGAVDDLIMGRRDALVAQSFLGWRAVHGGVAWTDDGCSDGSFTVSLVLNQRQ